MLSNQWTVKDFYPIEYIPAGVRLTAYGGDAADLSSTVLQEFLDAVADGSATVPIHRRYDFDQIQQAHADMEGGHCRWANSSLRPRAVPVRLKRVRRARRHDHGDLPGRPDVREHPAPSCWRCEAARLRFMHGKCTEARRGRGDRRVIEVAVRRSQHGPRARRCRRCWRSAGRRALGHRRSDCTGASRPEGFFTVLTTRIAANTAGLEQAIRDQGGEWSDRRTRPVVRGINHIGVRAHRAPKPANRVGRGLQRWLHRRARPSARNGADGEHPHRRYSTPRCT